MKKTYELYNCDYDGDYEEINSLASCYDTLGIHHETSTGRIKIELYLERWRTCDEAASYLEWATDQILKFKDLKGKGDDA